MNFHPTAGLPFEAILEDVSGGNRKVQKGDYLASGKFPIIDQGQQFIGGFTDSEDDLVQGEGPWIVFGDHTRALKYVDFPFCMGADGVKVLKARCAKASDTKFLYHFLQAQELPDAGYSRHFKFLKRLQISLPPLDEQRRIAAVLDKADALRRKRKRSIELLDTLTQSIFLEMFGDPVSNPKGIPSNKLGNVASFVSGGTPSKSAEDYWNGTIPWVSPKDMKVLEIFDAEDHVSDKALCETSLKRIEAHSVLLVVRGMILAHTVPLAITRTSTTINQDMKAIQFHSNVNPVFGLWCLLAQHDHILTKVSSAAHGTKRLDMDDVERFPILLPSDNQQALFLSAASKVTHNRLGAVQQSQAADALFSSLQHRAFSGQL